MKKLILTLSIAIVSNAPSFAQWTTLGTNIYNDNSANVGIGTTSPAAKLDVNGSQRLNGNLQFSSDQTAYFIHSAANGGAIRLRSNAMTTIDRDVQFGNINNNGEWNSYMTVANNGSVGIGTTSPSSILHLSNGGPSILLDANSQATDFKRTYIATSEVAAGDFVIGTRYDNNAVKSRNLYISNGGNLGIGTTSPSASLDIAGQIQISGNNSGTPPPGLSYGLFPYGGVGLGIFSGAYDPTQGIGIWTNPGGTKTEVMRILSGGNVGIGTTTPDSKLAVKGIIHSQEVKVDMTGWSDYVFEPNYDLPTLESVKTYIDKNHRLPGTPSTQEVVKNGINLGEIVNLQMKKIEELTLYLIEKNENEARQQKEIETLKRQVESLFKLTTNKTKQ